MATGAIIATIEMILPDAADQLEAFASATDRLVKAGDDPIADKGPSRERGRSICGSSAGASTSVNPIPRPSVGLMSATRADPVYADRRRMHGARGQALIRQLGELLGPPNQHLYDRGGLRRTHLRGHT